MANKNRLETNMLDLWLSRSAAGMRHVESTASKLNNNSPKESILGVSGIINDTIENLMKLRGVLARSIVQPTENDKASDTHA